MRKIIVGFVVLMFALAAFSSAVFAGGIEIGSKLEEFALKDPKGNLHNIRDLKGKNGTLIIFLSAQCPVVEAYDERINALAVAYREKGINFVGLYPNATECLNWVKHHSKKTYKFITLVDEGNVIADRFDAQYTPEVFYFNAGDTLDYHGAIDNDRSGRNIQTEFLKNAFESKLAGKEIDQKVTRAFGCSIKRVPDSKEGTGSEISGSKNR